MTAAATAAGERTSRIAPSGAPVDLTVPTAFGRYRWYGSTRFAGPTMARQFFLAPAGEHAAIPAKLLPGARERRQQMRGFDAVVFEAPDRSDSALVLAGPHHEATTWFGGPAPDVAGLNALISTFRFTDAENGASLVPTSDLLVRQSDVTLIGRSDASVLMVRRVTDALPTLPDWAGFRLPGGEMWRAGRVLDDRQEALVAGTPHQWRFLIAGTSAAMDLVLLGPESDRPRLPLDEEQVLAALGALTGSWAA
jgi:hypothetical protein